MSRKQFGLGTSLLYFTVALFIFSIWVWGAESPNLSFNGDPRSKLSDLIYGRAHKPFVQRALVPILTRTITDVVNGGQSHGTLSSLASIPKVKKEMERLQWEPDYLTEYIVCLSIAFLSLFGSLFVLRTLWDSFYTTSRGLSILLPIITSLLLPVFFNQGTHYIYDFPTFFFFNLGLVLLIRTQWDWYYPVFFLGCLNKETIIFLLLALWIVHFRKMTHKRVIQHSVAHLVIFLGVSFWLAETFSSNPGTTPEFHLYGNLHWLLMGYDFVGLTLLWLIGILVVYHLKDKPVILRKLLWLLVPIGLLILVFGVLVEIRSWMEVSPIVLFLIFHTILFDILGLPHMQRNPQL